MVQVYLKGMSIRFFLLNLFNEISLPALLSSGVASLWHNMIPQKGFDCF